MTEKEFWVFLKNSQAKGRIPQKSGYIDSDSLPLQKAGEYFSGHSILFEGHDKLPVEIINGMGMLLLDSSVTIKTKETILMILAHHPSKEALNFLKKYKQNPDDELRIIAELAYEECEWWNE